MCREDLSKTLQECAEEYSKVLDSARVTGKRKADFLAAYKDGVLTGMLTLLANGTWTRNEE